MLIFLRIYTKKYFNITNSQHQHIVNRKITIKKRVIIV